MILLGSKGSPRNTVCFSVQPVMENAVARAVVRQLLSVLQSKGFPNTIFLFVFLVCLLFRKYEDECKTWANTNSYGMGILVLGGQASEPLLVKEKIVSCSLSWK